MAAQCAQDANVPCVFTCNGTRFNLTTVFNYPVEIFDERDGYHYTWSPCEPFKCPDEIKPGRDCAVCQKADRYYNCGHLGQAIFLLNSYDPFQWKIQYTYGTDWRITEFTFVVDQNREKPVITFTGEQPYLQYNFYVIGKCIGQDYCRPGIPDPLLQPKQNPSVVAST